MSEMLEGPARLERAGEVETMLEAAGERRTDVGEGAGLASFFMGGFECSSHRRRDGKRLDLLSSTRHDRLAARDYVQLHQYGIQTVRDGMRWHLIETSPGRYDWSSFLPMLRAARETGTQVIWDLCHYGWPDDIDIWSPAFVDRFARFAAAAAQVVKDEIGQAPIYSPVNEISYWAWKGGDMGGFNPNCTGRGPELKRQLVRASLAAIDAVRVVEPRARMIHIDPVINVVAPPDNPGLRRAAENHRNAQYEAWDMLAGFEAHELGGRPDCIDLIGVNYYSDNQWYKDARTIEVGEAVYRPFREILAETYARYMRPILIAETGGEGDVQVPFFRYLTGEVRAAMVGGVPVEGICIYPILHYPAWDEDGRVCLTGLLAMADEDGQRAVDQPLADELRRQQLIFDNFFMSRGAAGKRTA